MSQRRMYVLTSWHDVPFEQDGLRDGEDIREWMHNVFAERLIAMDVPTLRVAGTLDARVGQCFEWIDERMKLAWRFADPLGYIDGKDVLPKAT